MLPIRHWIGKTISIVCYWGAWLLQTPSIRATAIRYGKLLRTIHREKAKRPINVLFLFNESSKWKCQGLYESLDSSDAYNPCIALTRADIDWSLADGEFNEKCKANERFCEKNGLRYVKAYIIEEKRALDLRCFAPDIVFYEHPWGWPKEQSIRTVSQFALTCYVPYYLPFYDAPKQDSQEELHRYVWRYYLLNQAWADNFVKRRHSFSVAGRFIGVGHPTLDLFANATERYAKTDWIIYAPHWTISGTNLENYSTFLETGKFILEYAKEHPEQKWLFKPHPTLPVALRKHSGWSESEISAYYDEWGKVGTVCLDGNYHHYFLTSRAMITDSSSFLVEYSAVNRPLIHLVSSKCAYPYAAASQELAKTFYQVQTLESLKNVLESVVEKGEDPHAEFRANVIQKMNLWHVTAARRITESMNADLGI